MGDPTGRPYKFFVDGDSLISASHHRAYFPALRRGNLLHIVGVELGPEFVQQRLHLLMGVIQRVMPATSHRT